ncbi:MAG: polysaccharide deacetylase [Clostridia bacterium]|nr:polysaccharide deacetylase [Clostridia bacterium]
MNKLRASMVILLLILWNLLILSGCSKNNTASISTVNPFPVQEDSASASSHSGTKPVESGVSTPKASEVILPEKAEYSEQQIKAPAGRESVTSAVYKLKNTKLKKKKIAYLTFDDGPSRNNTLKNLDTLKKYGIKATFFVLPQKDVDDVYRRILEEGHAIGNHSYFHDYHQLYNLTDFEFMEDVLMAKNFIKEKFNYTTTLYRFPGGTMGRSKKLLESRNKILESEGYTVYDWDISDGDSDTSEMGSKVEVLVNNVLQGAWGRNSLIVLMHDSPAKTATTEALPKIIDGLVKRGFSFDLLTNKIKNDTDDEG